MEEEVNNWNPKGGRPKKDPKELRNHPVNIKLTEDEKKDLYQEADDLGWKQPLVYFRNKLLSKNSGPGPNPHELFKALNKLSPELNKVGNNINQVARYVNYLDKNNMVDQKTIAEYNAHFKRMNEIHHEYALAIRAYLKSISNK